MGKLDPVWYYVGDYQIGEGGVFIKPSEADRADVVRVDPTPTDGFYCISIGTVSADDCEYAAAEALKDAGFDVPSTLKALRNMHVRPGASVIRALATLDNYGCSSYEQTMTVVTPEAEIAGIVNMYWNGKKLTCTATIEMPVPPPRDIYDYALRRMYDKYGGDLLAFVVHHVLGVKNQTEIDWRGFPPMCDHVMTSSQDTCPTCGRQVDK